MKRGLTYAEALEYLGVKRRTFDEQWRPRLIAIPQGSCLIFDRGDLDRLFDEFKEAAAGSLPAANDDTPTLATQNGLRNGWPEQKTGVKPWVNAREVSTRTESSGRSTSTTGASAFAGAVFSIKRKRKAG